MRTCVGCGVEQPLEKYKLRSSAGRQAGTRQRHCNRCLYLKYTKPWAAAKVASVQAYKVELGCADCGYNRHPAALQFDHRPSEVKLFNIGEQAGNYKPETIWTEIAKCDVVCANCHAIRTTTRREEVAV